MSSNARIGMIVQSIARKCGFKKYTSPHADKIKMYEEDIKTLANMYLTIKVFIGDLVEIEERHSGAKEFKAMLEKDIELLDKIDHFISREANKLKRMEDEASE